MTVIPLHSRTTTAAGCAGEVTFLRLEDRLLTARQVVVALASYLAAFDNFHGEVDPIHAILAQVLYGDLHGWQHTRTPAQVVVVLARAEQIARDYFGRTFPLVHRASRP